MKKMTPSGTRTRVTNRPLGRTLLAKISPTGSGSVATCSNPWAIPSRRDSVSRKRSMQGRTESGSLGGGAVPLIRLEQRARALDG